jgi:hypothetical protein|nr:MAG TPA: Major capsid protein [Caudoviricetes sp.]
MPKTQRDAVTLATADALKMWNADHGTAWQIGENWSNVNTEFETFINKYLFPKINETLLVSQALGNRFQRFAKEVDFIGQYSEEYVILDSVPVAMNLSKSEEMMLKREYPRMATKLYHEGIVKKMKFTLNNNDTRLNFSTLGDAINYATGVYRKKISDINVQEEREMKGMLVDYAERNVKDVRQVTSEEELFEEVFTALLNVQNNSEKHNEADTASGGALGRYTTVSKLDKLLILTTDKLKSYLLNTKIANTFANEGIDMTDHIMSFDDLGGTFRLTADVTIAEVDTIAKFRSLGDYQIAIGDILPKGTVLTFDISELVEFKGKVEEVKPSSDLWAFVLDVDCIRYKQYTKGMLKPPFYNGEYDEVTYWLHYYSNKFISPFYNKILVKGKAGA